MNNSTTAAQLAEVETGFFTGILTFLLLPWVSYIVITIFFIALIIFHERGQIGWSHIVFIIIVAYLLFKFNITDFKSIINNPLPILKWVIIYLIVGMAWSFLKWYLYLRNTLEEFNNTKEQIASSIKQTSNEKYDKEIFKRKLFSVFQYEKNGIKIEQSAIIETINVVLSEGKETKSVPLDIHEYKIINPQITKCKALVVSWIMHWPASLVWTLINDPIKKIINYIFKFIKSTFQKISDKMFKSVKSEL